MKPPLRGLFIAAVCFTAGLLAAPYGPTESVIRIGAVFLPLLVFVVISRVKKGNFSVILLFLAWFAIGWARGVPQPPQPLPNGRAWIEGVVTLPVEREGSSQRVRLKNIVWRRGSLFGRPAGKAVVEIPPEVQIEVADTLRAMGYLEIQDESRNPGDFNARAFWRSRGVDYRIRGPRLIEVRKTAGLSVFPERLFDRWRQWTESRFHETFPPNEAAIMSALFTGDRTGWDTGQRLQFARSGLMHLFAISGLHVGLLAMTLVMFLRLLRLPRRVALAGCLVLLWLFVPFAGGNPPVVRAVVMITMAIGGWLLERKYRPAYAMTLAYLLLLFWRPEGIRDAGFQLSFAGTAGAIFAGYHLAPALVMPVSIPRHKLMRELRTVVNRLLQALFVSLGAFLFTIPIIIFNFGRVPWLGPIIALPAGGLAWLAMIAGWLSLLFHGVPLLGVAYGEAARGVVELLNLLTRFSVRELPSSEFLPAGMALAGVLVAAVFVWSVWSSRRGPWERTLFGLIAAVTIIVWAAAWIPVQEVKLAILDVGQGDGVLLRRGRRAVIIDGGPASSHALLRQVTVTGISRIDLLILTHGDADHASAVRTLVGKIPIGAAVIGPGTWRDRAGKATVRALLDAGVPVYIGGHGVRVDLGALGKMAFLYPFPQTPLESSDDNSLSLVTTWHVNNATALFAGDLPSTIERELLKAVNPGEVDFLLAAHHGSRFSTSREWLEALSPEQVAVSCGRRNPYGHPTPEVLDRVQDAGAIIHRTDKQGALLFRAVDGGFKPVSRAEWW